MLVVVLATIAAEHAGNIVREQTSSLLQDLVIDGLQETEFQTAGLVTQKFQTLRGSAALLAEIIRDRIVGYPDDFENGQNVPFFDMETGENTYPLQGNKLPRDFELLLNWNEENLEEHVQERADIMQDYMHILSSDSATFAFQGNCDPNDTDPNGAGYLENCTEANNDATLGGVVHPVPTLAGLAKAADDLGIFLKPLWEADENAFQLNIFFFNAGAGATLSFPGLRGHSAAQYLSSGCEWMRETNPYTGRPYGGDEEIARCHPAGSIVPIRYYNPMEREFCHDQVLHPGSVRLFGPYTDSIYGQWRITIGQAVYDRKTGEFIACTGHDLNMQLAEGLIESVMVSNRTQVTVARLDGTIVAGVGLNTQNTSRTITVVEAGIVDQESYDELTADRFWESDYWSAASVQGRSESSVEKNGRITTTVLSPLPPDEYDKDYQPDFWIFVSADVEDVFGIVGRIDDDIGEEVDGLILRSVLIGLGGLFAFLLCVALVAHILTRPLNWMEITAWKIINHADERMSEELVMPHGRHDEDDPIVRYSPKTEIHELVSEFQTMIRGFSGTGSSRVALSKVGEVKNFITWKEDFRQFYQLNQTMEERIKEEMSQKAQSYGKRISLGKRSRGNNSSYGPTASEIIANFSEISQVSEEDATFRSADIRREHAVPKHYSRTESSTLFKRPLVRTNLGSNLPMNGSYGRINHIEENVRISRSKLFRLELCSLVLPLVLTNVVITALVTNNLLDSFPGALEKAEMFSIKLETDYLLETASLHASYGRQILPGSMRDLHLNTRMAGWLLFDVIPRSDGFADMELEMVEECKEYTADQVCPFDLDSSRSPCDCEWNDPWGRHCDNFSIRTRQLQRSWFVCQGRDYDPETGERSESISFPALDFNPVSTKWFTRVEEMPGFELGVNASGYRTTYDRIRVLSALQVVAMPVYNYASSDSFEGPHTSLSTFFAFEADGAYTGYAGCNYDASRYAQFKSSEENGAYLISPELCPVGKYGYDPRCRTWFSETKRKALWQDIFTHVTSPYQFAAVDDVGTSAASAVVDPATNEYVGTAGIDFAPTEFFDRLELANCDFYFVISAEEGADTIVGPDHPFSSSLTPIADVVLPYDAPNSDNRIVFANITSAMKAGESGLRYFNRKSEGGTETRVALSFAPVYARVLRPLQPDDFSGGAKASQVLLYSVGVAKVEESLQRPLGAIEVKIDSVLEATAIIFVSSVAAITFICIIINAKISIAITKPMLILLRVVQRVNAGRIEDDMPPLQGGSREVTQVYSSFAKLYKIVRMSNSSFFLGDYKWAHHIAEDALKLFRKIGDEKAVAIACNNIGNTLLALSTQKKENFGCFKTDGVCCVQAALRNFDEAIAIGTKEFEESDTDAKKAAFAQQLADRHFNRAMCLLHCKDDACCHDDAKEKAFADLLRCREYDRGVQEFMLHEKLMFKYSDVVFERLLRRINGLSSMFSVDRTVWQVWDVNDLVEQADLMLQAAWDQDNAPLFRDVSRVGRLQQLEGAVVGLELTSGKLEEATQLAMRMLIEDEYIIDSSFVVAADTLLRFMKEPNLTWTREAKLRTSLEFRRMRRAGKRTALDIERCFVFCLELGDKLAKNGILAQVNMETLALFDEQCNGNDTVGTVCLNSAENNAFTKLAPKESNEIEQRDTLDNATRQTSGNTAIAALPTAVNLISSPSRSRTSDVFLIFISDGSTWDPASFSAMQQQIREVSSKRTASINIIAIGIEVENEEFADACRGLCLATRSHHSSYLVADKESIHDVFERAANLIASGSSSESSRIQLGITMERF